MGEIRIQRVRSRRDRKVSAGRAPGIGKGCGKTLRRRARSVYLWLS